MTKMLKAKTCLLTTALTFVCLTTSTAQSDQFITDNANLVTQVKALHRFLEEKYNIESPTRYHRIENYTDIGSMYGPKGYYKPSIPNAVAICYGVFIHPNGRILPDPAYADTLTVENTEKVLKRRHEFARLEYISIKTYNQKIAQAMKLEGIHPFN